MLLLMAIVLAPAMLVLPGCDGDDDDGGTTAPTPPMPDSAVIVVEVTAVVATTPSPATGFQFRTTVPTRITESAGVGANINFIRLEFFAAGARIEVSEIGAGAIIAATGSNRLEGNSSRSDVLQFDNNTANIANTGLLTYDFTDDRGNRLQADFAIDF